MTEVRSVLVTTIKRLILEVKDGLITAIHTNVNGLSIDIINHDNIVKEGLDENTKKKIRDIIEEIKGKEFNSAFMVE